jgi:hypothetical protein
MTTLTINRQQVTVDDSFLKLTPEQQEAEVNHIASQMGANKTTGGVAEPAPQGGGGIPMAPAGAVIGAATGAATGPAIGKTIDTGINTAAKFINPAAAPQQDALTRALSGAPESNAPQAVQNWLKTQTSNPFAGGKDMSGAYKKSQLAAGEPVQSRGSNIPIRKGNLGISNQLPEPTPSERVASSILNAERVGAPHMLRRVAGMGVAGGELGNLIEEAEKGNYGRAALSGLGALGGAATQSRIKPVRAIGTALAAGVPAVQYFLPEDAEHKADGGLVHLAGGGQPESKLKKITKHIPMPATANLALNLGLGASDISQSHENLQKNLQAGNYGSAANNAIDLGSTVSPYMLVPSIYQGGRAASEFARNQLAENPHYRQQMQDMSSTPMGGAMTGDAGLAAQIMGQHEFEEDPGPYGHLLRDSNLPHHAAGGKIIEGAMSLAKKFGVDPYKISQAYPDVIAPMLAVDAKTGKEFLQKQLSPEALGVQKARKAAQKEIDAGNYQPHFDIEQRYYADPSHYPTAGYTATDIVPKKADTIAKYEALANDPEALARLRGAYEKAKDRPAAKDWYAMGQLEDAFIKELGPEEGRKQFKNRFADAMAATTGGADPNSNLMMAAYTNFQKNLGHEIPTKAADLPFPIGGRFVGGNMEQAKKLADAGEIPVTNPKRHNFSANFLGHRDVSTLDEQMSQLWDPKMKSPPPNAYGIYQQALAKEAEKAGVQPANFQDIAWAGAKDYPGKPMMQEINEMLARTSKITGEPQEEVLKGFIRADKPMYGIGALGASEAMNQDDAQPKKKGGKVKKAKKK